MNEPLIEDQEIKESEQMKRIKQFITKSSNEVEDAYCWHNTEKKLSSSEVEDLKDYFNKKNYNFMIIINGCSQLRPQRTWSTFPIFLKGIDGCHTIYKSDFNAFILCSWMEDYEEYQADIKELLSTIPDDLETIILTKNQIRFFQKLFYIKNKC